MLSDLYPDDEWNFVFFLISYFTKKKVFGEASFRKRTGVFSLARYDDNFYSQE